MAAARDPNFLHLVRLDAAKVHGWQVRLPLWHPLSSRHEYTELFSDTVHGGDAAALKAARRRRDQLFREAGLQLRNGGHTTNSKSTTGLVGVVLAFDGRRRGLAAFNWVAMWSSRKGQHKRSFNVQAHSFLFALLRAIEIREKNSGLIFSDEQLELALSLEEEVHRCARTGEPLRREPQRPPRTRPVLTAQA